MRRQTKQLLSVLQATSLIGSIIDVKGVFKDEPDISVYKLRDDLNAPLLHNTSWKYGSMAASTSPDEALYQASTRTIAKYSLFSLKSYPFLHASYNKMKDKAVNPLTFIKKTNPEAISYNDITKESTYGWVKAENITTQKISYIPTQYIYPVYFSQITYKTNLTEPYLINQRCIVNGRGFGFDKASATIEAIYETIETDAAVSLYTTGLFPPLIIYSPKNKIKELVRLYNDKHLNLYTFQITNTIPVPVFLSVLVDKRIGSPALSMGLGVGFDTDDAVQNSLKHALCQRIQARANFQVYGNPVEFIKTDKDYFFGEETLRKGSIIPIREWRYLRHIFNNTFSTRVLPNRQKLTKEETVKELIHLLKTQGYEIWRKEVTDPVFKHLGITVMKVFIPGLQEKLLGDNKDEDGVVENRVKYLRAHSSF